MWGLFRKVFYLFCLDLEPAFQGKNGRANPWVKIPKYIIELG